MLELAVFLVAIGALTIGLSIGFIFGRKPMMYRHHAEKRCPHGDDVDLCPAWKTCHLCDGSH